MRCRELHKFLVFTAVAVLCIAPLVTNGNPDRIKLKDTEVLTLYQGRYTSARRSHPVLQLQCTGGTAGCQAFVPKVVQCYNRRSDGYDVQWECKTDMDNAYRFGQIAVSCEGYDYPDDPYILRGSCGLEYELDLTLEGHQHQHSQTRYVKDPQSLVGPIVSWLILICALVVIGSVVWMYIANSRSQVHYDPPPPYPGYTVPPTATAPPPPGFRPEYTSPDAGAHHSYSSFWQTPPASGAAHSPPGGGGGFWSGAMTGGLLGYLFGSRNQNRHYNTPQYQPQNNWWGSSGTYSPPHQSTNSWWSSSSGTSSGSNFGSSHGSNAGSTGTRTASGFGGTRRR